MKIVVDAQSILEQQVGIGKLTTNLMRNLLGIDKNNQYKLVVFGDPLRMHSDEFKIHFTWFPRKIYMGIWKFLGIRIPYNWLAGRADVYFFPNYVKLPTTRGRSVIAIHDLTYVKYPETIEPKHLRFLNKFMQRSVDEADQIITISGSSKNDILEHYQLQPGKVTVIFPALPTERDTTPSEEEIGTTKKKLGLSEYILFVGTFEPRKNIPFLIKAFEQIAKKFPNLSLVLVGKRGWGVDEIDRAIASSPVKDRIILPGYMSDEKMPSLFAGASVFAFPSIYEGFGIPVLEAFSYNIPVVTSNVSSLPEVAGDGAILIDPHSQAELVEALTKILSDVKLKDHLVRNGKVQLSKFSWDKSAETFINLLKSMEDK